MTHTAPRAFSGPSLRIHGIVFLFTLASALAINPYFYGTSDNSITIPFLKAFVDPRLYPGDYLIAERQYYYTYLWNVLGFLHAHLRLSIPALFFATYLAALYGTFLAVYLIAQALFASFEVGVLAMAFLLFSKTTLADVSTIEMLLNTRAVATPLLLLALYFFLRGGMLPAFALMGLAYLVHPLTTHYVLAMLVIAALARSRGRDWAGLLKGLLLFGVIASPLLIWRFRHAPPSLHLLSADPRWVTALRYRSSHHMFPFTWGAQALVHAVVVAGLFIIGWRGRNREADDRHRVILIAVWTIAAMCAFGVVFSELHPLGVTFLVQPLRSFVFLEYFVALYVAHHVYRRLESPRGIVDVLVPAGAALLMADWTERPFAAALTFLAVIGTMTLSRIRWDRALAGARFGLAVASIACVAAGACYAYERATHGLTLLLVNDEVPLWRDVERWAREKTDIRDGFIVPPDEEQEFRVEGERTVYADLEDGGLMNSDPAFGVEWLRRMRMLGFMGARAGPPDLCHLKAAQVRRIAREMRGGSRRVFLVWPCVDQRLGFPVRYRNDAYLVYEVI